MSLTNEEKRAGKQDEISAVMSAMKAKWGTPNLGPNGTLGLDFAKVFDAWGSCLRSYGCRQTRLDSAVGAMLAMEPIEKMAKRIKPQSRAQAVRASEEQEETRVDSGGLGDQELTTENSKLVRGNI